MTKHIKTDPWDDHEWVRANMDSQRLANLNAQLKGNPGWETFQDVTADTFQMLRQSIPEMIDTGMVPTLHATLLQELESTQEFQDLRAYTVGDTTAAALATETFGKQLFDEFCREFPEGDLNEPFNGDDHGDALDDLRGKSRAIFEAAKGEIETATEAGECFGDEAGPAQTSRGTPMREKLAAHDRIKRSGKLEAMIKLAGRFRRLALAKRAAVVKNIKQEYVGVTTGKDVSKCVPSELLLLANPLTAPLFYKKLAEGQLMIYEQSGAEKLCAGPIVICLDGSYSMNGAKETWSKAIVMAYMAIAQNEKRDVIIREFGHSSELNVYEFRYSKPDSVTREGIMNMLTTFLGGDGTDLQTPLDWAKGIIATDKLHGGKWEKADILMITDGLAPLDSEFVGRFANECNALGVSTFGIAIGSGVEALTQVMPREHVLNIADLNAADDAALEMLFAR